jgi:hypothetical protein
MEIFIVVSLSVAVGIVTGVGLSVWRADVRDRRLREMPLLGVVLPPEKGKK